MTERLLERPEKEAMEWKQDFNNKSTCWLDQHIMISGSQADKNQQREGNVFTAIRIDLYIYKDYWSIKLHLFKYLKLSCWNASPIKSTLPACVKYTSDHLKANFIKFKNWQQTSWKLTNKNPKTEAEINNNSCRFIIFESVLFNTVIGINSVQQSIANSQLTFYCWN